MPRTKEATSATDAEPLPTWEIIRGQLNELTEAVAAGDGPRARGLADALAVSPWPASAVPLGVSVTSALGELATEVEDAADVALALSAIESVARERGGYWVTVADRCRTASSRWLAPSF